MGAAPMNVRLKSSVCNWTSCRHSLAKSRGQSTTEGGGNSCYGCETTRPAGWRRNTAGPGPTHQVLGALQEAEAHAGAIARAQPLAVHGHDAGSLQLWSGRERKLACESGLGGQLASGGRRAGTRRYNGRQGRTGPAGGAHLSHDLAVDDGLVPGLNGGAVGQDGDVCKGQEGGVGWGHWS